MNDRPTEKEIDLLITKHLKGAIDGDPHAARSLHELLAWCMTGRGSWWLTPFARLVSYQMHKKLSQCEGTGDGFNAQVAAAVLLKSTRGQPSQKMRDYMIHAHVRHQLKQTSNMEAACKAALKDGGFVTTKKGAEVPMEWSTLKKIYYEIERTRTKD